MRRVGRRVGTVAADQGVVQRGPQEEGAEDRRGEEVMGHLREGRTREAWGTNWGWHKAVEAKAAKSCSWKTEDQTREQEELYGFNQPPGERIPQNAERAPSDDGPPTDELRI